LKKKFWFLPSLILAAMLWLSGCAAPTEAPNPLTGTIWRLVSYGPAAAQKPAVPNVPTRLTFGRNSQLSGTFGCNSLGWPYSIQGNRITFGALVATMMACSDPQMAQEGAVFQVLKGTAGFKLDGSRLTITAQDGNGALIFEAATGE